MGQGNVHYGLGYTSGSVAPTHLGGKILAALATHADDGFTRLAVVTKRPKRFPPRAVPFARGVPGQRRDPSQGRP